MLNLKVKKKRTASQASIERVGRVIKSVNDMIAIGLLKWAEDGSSQAFIYPEFIATKDSVYKKNFSANLLVYWKVHSRKTPEETVGCRLEVREMESKEILFTFLEGDDKIV